MTPTLDAPALAPSALDAQARVRELIALAQAGSTRARNRAVEDNMGLVWTAARQLAPRSPAGQVDEALVEDLVQAGVFGLMIAIERFDLRRGVQFSTYATPWIRREVRRARAEALGLIRIPAGLAVKLHRAEADGRPRTDDHARDAARAAAVRHLPAELPAPPATPTAEASPELVAALGAALDRLGLRERLIVTRIIGLGREPESRGAIGRDLGITRQRVAQIHAVALGKLRGFLEATGLDLATLIRP